MGKKHCCCPTYHFNFHPNKYERFEQTRTADIDFQFISSIVKIACILICKNAELDAAACVLCSRSKGRQVQPVFGYHRWIEWKILEAHIVDWNRNLGPPFSSPTKLFHWKTRDQIWACPSPTPFRKQFSYFYAMITIFFFKIGKNINSSRYVKTSVIILKIQFAAVCVRPKVTRTWYFRSAMHGYLAGTSRLFCCKKTDANA